MFTKGAALKERLTKIENSLKILEMRTCDHSYAEAQETIGTCISGKKWLECTKCGNKKSVSYKSFYDMMYKRAKEEADMYKTLMEKEPKDEQ